MRTEKNILFLASAIALFAVVMLFNQQRIHAEQTAVTATSNWRDPFILTDETKNSVAPVLRQDSAGNMIVVYSSQLGGSVGNHTPFNRMWSGGSWAGQASLYNLGDDGVTPDVVYDTTDKAHAVWVNDAEQVFYADEEDWASVVDEVPTTPASGVSESAVAIDSSNRLHVVWLQGGTTLYYATYSGDSWFPPAEIDDETGISASFPPAIAVDDNDIVHVVWRSIGSGGTQLAYKNTPAGTPFPSTSTSLSGSVPSPQSPFLLADGNRVHLSFTNYTEANSAQQIYYVELTDDGGWGGTSPEAIGNTFYTNIGTGTSVGSVSSMTVCGDDLHLFYYGNALSLTERIWELSKEDSSWTTEPTAVTVSDGDKRAINPYAVCSGSVIHLVYEGITGVISNPQPHTINYTSNDDSGLVYLPVILK